MWKVAFDHIAIGIDDNNDDEQVEIKSHCRLIDRSMLQEILAVLKE